jgi:hypothetical protein
LTNVQKMQLTYIHFNLFIKWKLITGGCVTTGGGTAGGAGGCGAGGCGAGGAGGCGAGGAGGCGAGGAMPPQEIVEFTEGQM